MPPNKRLEPIPAQPFALDGRRDCERSFARMFLGLWSACCKGRGWGKFYRRQCAAAIPDLEIAWRHERSPILVGGPLGQADQHCPFDGSLLR